MQTLIKRCLAYGVTILPYKLNSILEFYEKYKLPDDVLCSLSKENLEKYIKGLSLSSNYEARDWTKGHKILIGLGFKKVERNQFHRTFVSLEYPDF